MMDAAIASQRRVAVLIADGIKAEPVAMIAAAMREISAVPCLLSPGPRTVRSSDGQEFVADLNLDTVEPAEFDALVLPDGDEAVTRLLEGDQSIDLLIAQCSLGHPIFVGSASVRMLDAAGITESTHAPDRGFFIGIQTRLPEAVAEFAMAVGRKPHAE